MSILKIDSLIESEIDTSGDLSPEELKEDIKRCILLALTDKQTELDNCYQEIEKLKKINLNNQSIIYGS